MEISEIQKRLLDDQQRVCEAAKILQALLAKAGPADGDVLAKARWGFASVLMQHLALMERHVYAKLERDNRETVKSFFAETKADLLQCFAAYSEHMESWPTSRALGHWVPYRDSAMAVVDRFVRRLELQEATLFSFIRRMDIDIAHPSTVTSNWVRNAFAIKDSVEKR